LNNIHGGKLIYRVREQSISQGYQKCKREHSKAMYTGSGDTGMQRWAGTRSETILNKKQGWDLITSKFMEQKFWESQKSCGNDSSGFLLCPMTPL